MEARRVLNTLDAAGITVVEDGGRLVASPSSALTDELRELIRAHKAALLELVTVPQGVSRRLAEMIKVGAIDEADAALVRARYRAYPDEWDFLLDLCVQARREAKA